ncbi:MAG: hypothetical protein IK065_00140 [Neisseriaceae bacterium]|nr:hypothetical protein [Neisseriaceae bacterium]
MGFPAHQNAVGVNLLYFNNFLFSSIGRLVGWEAHPTAFLFQKLGLKDKMGDILITYKKILLIGYDLFILI